MIKTLNEMTTLIATRCNINVANFYLAGGCVRDTLINEVPKDYDVYFTDRAWSSRFVRMFNKHVLDYKLLAVTPNAITIDLEGYKVQFIIHPLLVGDPLSVINKFDFTCCHAYHQRGVTHTTFRYKKLLNKKKLVLNHNSSYIQYFRTMLRMFSFLKRGYSISIFDFGLVMIGGLLDGVVKLFTQPKEVFKSVRSMTGY